jgi:hypothetical protein
MGFYGPQPVTAKNCKATYVWTGLNTPGFFFVEVEGDAKNYSSGFTLVRDPNWVGGLKINSMGWTGPLGEGTKAYKVTGSFPGAFNDQIVIAGSNGNFVINVDNVPHDEADTYFQSKAS